MSRAICPAKELVPKPPEFFKQHQKEGNGIFKNNFSVVRITSQKKILVSEVVNKNKTTGTAERQETRNGGER